MPRDNELLKLRNNNLKTRFLELLEAHPEWRLDAIKSTLSTEFYLSVSRVERILNNK